MSKALYGSKRGFPPGFPRQEAPSFCFLPVFSAGGCVKVSGGFLYKLLNNLGRSQRFPFQGGSAPFCWAGFVKQNLGWELAPPGSTLVSPLSAPLPPSTYQLRRKSFAQLLRENHLPAKNLQLHTKGISCEPTAFSFSAGKTLRAKGTRPPDGPNRPLFSADGKATPQKHETAPVGPMWPASGDTTA